MSQRLSLASMVALSLIVLGSRLVTPALAAEGQVTFAATVSIAPTWFDPAETPGVITPFLTLYALHDALVKPMPGNAFAPGLAESWTAAKDGLSYEFVLRKNVRFHNGDPLTADDVKFSFERYKGGGAATLKARVAAVEIADGQRVRFRLKHAMFAPIVEQAVRGPQTEVIGGHDGPAQGTRPHSSPRARPGSLQEVLRRGARLQDPRGGS